VLGSVEDEGGIGGLYRVGGGEGAVRRGGYGGGTETKRIETGGGG